MPVTLDQKLKFRSSVLPIFQAVHDQFQIDPRIALVQSALESNWGVSQLATEGFNIFSITPGSHWVQMMNKQLTPEQVPPWSVAGIPTVYYPTKEYSKHSPEHIHYWDFPGDIVSKNPDGKGGSICVVNRYFRKYLSWTESAIDWAKKISIQPIYQDAYHAALAGDVSLYAHAMVAAGYATDESYAGELINEAAVVDALSQEAAS